MRITLMSNIEHKPIASRIIDAMDRHGQLNRAEIGRQMAARLRDGFNQEFPNLPAKRLKFFTLYFLYVFRGMYSL